MGQVLFVDAPYIFQPGWNMVRPCLKSYANLVSLSDISWISTRSSFLLSGFQALKPGMACCLVKTHSFHKGWNAACYMVCQGDVFALPAQIACRVITCLARMMEFFVSFVLEACVWTIIHLLMDWIPCVCISSREKVVGTLNDLIFMLSITVSSGLLWLVDFSGNVE